MKYSICCCFSLMIACCINAQSKTFSRLSETFPLKTFNNNFQHHIFKLSDTTIIHFQQLQDNAVLKLPAPKLTCKGNANSFDIYQATPDQMFVVKPDSTILFNMPVAFKIEKKAVGISNEPFS